MVPMPVATARICRLSMVPVKASVKAASKKSAAAASRAGHLSRDGTFSKTDRGEKDPFSRDQNADRARVGREAARLQAVEGAQHDRVHRLHVAVQPSSRWNSVEFLVGFQKRARSETGLGPERTIDGGVWKATLTRDERVRKAPSSTRRLDAVVLTGIISCASGCARPRSCSCTDLSAENSVENSVENSERGLPERARRSRVRSSVVLERNGRRASRSSWT